jgi:hypothetical protein
MGYYVCKRCGYSTHIKCNLHNHFKRKTLCPALISDISIEELRNNEITSQSHRTCMTRQSSELECDGTQHSTTNAMQPSNNTLCLEQSPKYVCELCQKQFSNRQGKYQHKKYCIGTRQLSDTCTEDMELLKKEMLMLKDEVERLKRETTNRATNNTYINITKTTNNNTFILNNYKQVSTDFLPPHVMTKLLSKTYFDQLYDSLREVVRLVYYNAKHPENHSIFIPNIRDKYARVWNGKGWLFKNRDEILTLMRNRSIELMNDFFFDNEQTFSMIQKQHLRKWHERYFDDADKIFDRQTKSAVEETILSYQTLVKDTLDRYNLL